MQTAILYNQTFIIKSFPILSLNEGLFFYAWILLTFSLIINLFPIHFIVLFVNIFSFFILILSITINAQHLSYEVGAEFVHEILMIHITLRSEEHTSELQSRGHLVCRLLLEK